MKRKSAMERISEEVELGQGLVRALAHIVDAIAKFGAPYVPRVAEDPLLGTTLRVLSTDTEDKVVVVLGDLDEFEVTEDTDEALEIHVTRGVGDDKYRFRSDGLVEVKSRSALFAADIDFTTGGTR